MSHIIVDLGQLYAVLLYQVTFAQAIKNWQVKLDPKISVVKPSILKIGNLTPGISSGIGS
jgi:hypothetical protein